MKKVYLIAVIFAIIAGVATYMFATEIDKKTTFKDADMVTVLIPTADIDKNVEITADMVIILKLSQKKFLLPIQMKAISKLKKSLLMMLIMFI